MFITAWDCIAVFGFGNNIVVVISYLFVLGYGRSFLGMVVCSLGMVVCSWVWLFVLGCGCSILGMVVRLCIWSLVP